MRGAGVAPEVVGAGAGIMVEVYELYSEQWGALIVKQRK